MTTPQSGSTLSSFFKTKQSGIRQPMRDFITAVRTSLTPDDTFGQQVIRLQFREKAGSGKGLFKKVRAICDAVSALGGTITDARIWTGQAVRWMQTGKAVDAQFARFEVDPAAAKAMNELLKMLKTHPAELLQFAPAKPLSRPNPFGSPPPPPNPFRPPAAQATPPKPPSPFGTRPPVLPNELLPVYVAACFEALAIEPDKTNALKQALEELQSLKSQSQNTATEQPPLPTDLKGLIERWHKAVQEQEDTGAILQALGALGDMRIIDYLHHIRTASDDVSDGITLFKTMGGDVGVAGMFSLLPIEEDKRSEWLIALSDIAIAALRDGKSLAPATNEALFEIASKEIATDVPFCIGAFTLLGATGHPKASNLLWEHAKGSNTERRRAALLALAQSDPGDRLYDLLFELDDIPDTLLPRSPFSSPFGRPAPVAVEPAFVGVPFEQLTQAVLGSKVKARRSALWLIAYCRHGGVTPFLISQLSRRIPKIREVALKHVRRLNIIAAADAVAELMVKDSTLRQRAADILCEWNDPRCVPILLDDLNENIDPGSVISRIGRLGHPRFDEWLNKTIDNFGDELRSEAEEPLVDVIENLTKAGYPNFRIVADKLVSSPHQKVRMALVNALEDIHEDWARFMLMSFINDKSHIIAYRVAKSCTDLSIADEFAANKNEVFQLIATRIYWNVENVEGLSCLLLSKSAAVRDLTLWALSQLKPQDYVGLLENVVAREDQIDVWGQIPALIAWRGLAKVDLPQ